MSPALARERMPIVIVFTIGSLLTSLGCEQLDGRNRNRAANRMFKDSNFATALGEYEKAVKAVDDPIIHYNLGLTYSKVYRVGVGEDKLVRLQREGSETCSRVPGVSFAKADVCTKEGDAKFSDCTDLKIPAAGAALKGNAATAKLGAALETRDLATAATELTKIEANLDCDQKKAFGAKLDEVHALLAGACPSSYKCESINLCSIENNKLNDLATTHFQSWLKGNPTDDDTKKLVTQLWIDSGQFPKAIAFWEEALKAKPDSPDIIGVLAGINLKAGDWRKSIDWFQKVAGLAKDNANKIAAFQFIGNVAWGKLSSKSLTPAQTIELADLGIGALGHVIEIEPKSPKAFGLMGSIFNFRAMAHGSSIAWNIDRATARDLQLNSCVLNDEAKKANCPCKVLQVGCPPPPPAPVVPPPVKEVPVTPTPTEAPPPPPQPTTPTPPTPVIPEKKPC
ncbi:MAG: hypothetical protein NT062_29620 [Proteobacteria bacterium]|nr:hypothetical protein [Pseudomonadota bacterium]